MLRVATCNTIHDQSHSTTVSCSPSCRAYPSSTQISQVDSRCGGCSWDPDFKIAAAHVISPPLRSKQHQLALRRALAGGHLHLVGTDHCGWNSTQKAVGRHDFRCHSVLIMVQHEVQKAEARNCLLAGLLTQIARHSACHLACEERSGYLLAISMVLEVQCWKCTTNHGC